jgi:hypothetical protein
MGGTRAASRPESAALVTSAASFVRNAFRIQLRLIPAHNSNCVPWPIPTLPIEPTQETSQTHADSALQRSADLRASPTNVPKILVHLESPVLRLLRHRGILDPLADGQIASGPQ